MAATLNWFLFVSASCQLPNASCHVCQILFEITTGQDKENLRFIILLVGYNKLE